MVFISDMQVHGSSSYKVRFFMATNFNKLLDSLKQFLDRAPLSLKTVAIELMNCWLDLVSCFWLVPAKLWQQINEAYAPADSLAVCSWWEQPSFAENTSAWLPLIGTHTLTLSLCPLSEAVSSYIQSCPAHIFLGQAVRRGKHQKFAAKFDNLLLSRRGI